MIFRDQDIGETFIVTQQNVVTRLQFLDQVGFKQQGFGFGVGGDNFHPHRLGHHAGNAQRQAGNMGVAGHPFFQVLGLAHIQDAFLLVDHAINTRNARHRF